MAPSRVRASEETWLLRGLNRALCREGGRKGPVRPARGSAFPPGRPCGSPRGVGPEAARSPCLGGLRGQRPKATVKSAEGLTVHSADPVRSLC